jgi:hypothetical protein
MSYANVAAAIAGLVVADPAGGPDDDDDSGPPGVSGLSGLSGEPLAEPLGEVGSIGPGGASAPGQAAMRDNGPVRSGTA